jgi:hypothetical protein
MVHPPHPVTEPYSLTHLAVASVGYCLHNLFSLPAPTTTTSLPGAQAIFRANLFTYPTFSTAVTLHTHPPMKMEQSVPKRWHLNYRCRGITWKIAYKIQRSFTIAALWPSYNKAKCPRTFLWIKLSSFTNIVLCLSDQHTHTGVTITQDTVQKTKNQYNHQHINTQNLIPE